MKLRISKWLKKRYPQNFILRNPYVGALIILVFMLGFILIYRPLSSHAAKNLSYIVTMSIYSLSSAISIFVFIVALRQLKYFSNRKNWTLSKELLSIVFTLSGMAISIYFTGFFVEEPGPRWNLPTFFDSYINAFLIGIIPFLFFTIMNYPYFKTYNIAPVEVTNDGSSGFIEQSIQINSKLKKEKLSFIPSQFLYATSDGNYVEFYLDRDNKIDKEIIRNSISNIDKQLSQVPFFMRTHRAFIVNVKKADIRNGNTLGYRLKISGIDDDIPVSRQYTRDFIQLYNQYTK